VETITRQNSNSERTLRKDETDQYESAIEQEACSGNESNAMVEDELNVIQEEEIEPRPSTREKKSPKYLENYCWHYM